MTFAAFITGGLMLLLGDTGEKIGKFVFPGGVAMENVSIPVVLIGFASSVLWMLLKAKASTKPDESSSTVNFKSARTNTRAEENIPDPMMGRGQAAQRGPTISDQFPKSWAEWTKRRNSFWERH
jgi:hypothetical protein